MTNTSVNTVQMQKIKSVIQSLSFVSDSIILPVHQQIKSRYNVYVSLNELDVDQRIKGNLVDLKKLRTRFKGEQRNLRRCDISKSSKLSMNPRTDLSLQVNSRKSYRQFIQDYPVSLSDIQKILNTCQHQLDHHNPIHYELSELMSQCLSVFQGIPIDSTYGFKYLYPSAGALYPIRVYSSSRTLNGEIASIHYYHPIEHTLNTLYSSLHDQKSSEEMILSFTAALPAIKPLYGDISLKYCEIECGHMLKLLTAFATQKGYSLHQLTSNEYTIQPWLEEDEIPLCTYILNKNKSPAESLNSSRNLEYHTYLYIKNKHHINNGLYAIQNERLVHLNFVNDYPISFDHQGDNACIVDSADFLILFSAESSPDNHMSVGARAQEILNNSIESNIGLCPIGIFPENDKFKSLIKNPIIYCLAGGYINDEQIANTNISTPSEDLPSVKKYIKHILTQSLIDAELINDIYIFGR